MNIEVCKEVVKIFEKKGWALYHYPAFSSGLGDLRRYISRGREKEKLIKYEVYIILPLIEDDKDTEKVFDKMEWCLITGRLPFFIRLGKSREKYIPLWVLPIEYIGIGENKITLLSTPNLIFQYMKFLKYPNPLEFNDVYFVFGLVGYDAELEELQQITKCEGNPRFYIQSSLL